MLAWLRSSTPLWLLAPLALACTRENPAFETGGDELAEAEGSETGQTGDEAETTAPACEYDPGTELVIKLPEFCDDTMKEGLNVFDYWLRIAEAADDRWRVDATCLEGCDPSFCQTLQVPFYVQVSTLDTASLAGAGQCIHVVASKPEFEGSTQCDFEAIAVWRHLESRPLVVASKSELRIAEALSDSIALTPELEPDLTCECEGLENAACCPASAAPGQWHFVVGSEKYAVGDSDVIGESNYSFHALQAHNETGCSGDTEQAWTLVRLN